MPFHCQGLAVPLGTQGKLWCACGSHHQVPEALSPDTSKVWGSDVDSGSALELGLLLWAPVAALLTEAAPM